MRADLRASGGPLVEEIVDDDGRVLVTFVWIGDAVGVSVRGTQFPNPRGPEHPMTKVDGTDIWHWSAATQPDVTTVYQYAVEDPPHEESAGDAADQPDASYVATMNAINDRIQNPLFFLSFFGAVLLLLAAVAVHFPKRRSGRFRLIALACVLYIGSSFLLTVLVNAPLNEGLATVDPDAPRRVLAEVRAAYEGPWNFWNGVRAVSSSLAFVALVGACLLR